MLAWTRRESEDQGQLAASGRWHSALKSAGPLSCNFLVSLRLAVNAGEGRDNSAGGGVGGGGGGFSQ